MSTKKFLVFSADETKKIGESLGKKIKKINTNKNALIVALKGELSSGKTTFLQGFAKGLGVREKILSPTFLIVKKFKIPNTDISRFKFFYHIDCYRMSEKDIENLSFFDIFSKKENIVAIEWAEKIENILPKERIEIFFKIISFSKREITIKNFIFKTDD